MKINPKSRQAYQLLHDGVLAFARAERQGMRVDINYCEREKERLTHKITRLEADFKRTKFWYHWQKVYGLKANPGSDWQLAHLLYKVRKLKPVRTTDTGKGATDEEALRQLGIPEVEPLLKIKKLRKLRDTYLDAFIRETVDGYMHPFFNAHLVKSFRSSSDRPNFQNIPKRDKEAMKICRRAILPRPGHQLGEIDYSGIEVKVSACYHKDPSMLRYVTDPASDMHGDMARQIFIMQSLDRSIPEHKYLRDAAKNGFVFPQFYGDYYGNCAEELACHWGELPKGKWKSGQGVSLVMGTLSDHLIHHGITSYQKFEDHVKQVEKDFWNNRFRVYDEWKTTWWRQYQLRGHIDMLTGFRCSGVMWRNEVINIPIQGSAFHCLLWSFIAIDRIMREEHWQTRLIGQIHDAIVLDIWPPELDHVMATMQRVMCIDLPKAWPWIIVPLEVEADICPVDGSWNEKQSYQLPKNKA